jgi:uncharacterized membrane protein YeaQ/YmgE (transglycosylase-associated protein family)
VTILIWLILGAAIGLVGAHVQHAQGAARLLNIGAGIIGALAGGLAEGRGAIGGDPWKITALIVAAAGAVILIGIINLFRRRPAA